MNNLLPQTPRYCHYATCAILLTLTISCSTAEQNGVDEFIHVHSPDIYTAIQLIHEDHDHALDQHFAAGEDAYAFQYDWQEALAPFQTWVHDAQNAKLRKALLLTYLQFGVEYDNVFWDVVLDASLARTALSEIEPTDSLWVHTPKALYVALEHAGQRDHYATYIQTVLDQHPTERVRSRLRFELLKEAIFANRPAEAESLYADLVAETREDALFPTAAHPYLLIGKQAPDFQFPALENGEAPHTRDVHKGTVYLIDFWATWCSPCLREMPYLHDAYEQFKDQGFTILSVSFDDQRDDVQTYRQQDWEMPWLHAFLGRIDKDAPEVSAFLLSGFPDAVLVDQHGVLLSRGDRLRGHRLAETLRVVLDTP